MENEVAFQELVENGRQTVEGLLQRVGNIPIPGTRRTAPIARDDARTIEEYVHKLRYYLPVDFGDEENNEYLEYLVQACCENYINGKYQFSLMAFHMMFMAVLYKEFWIMKQFSSERVAALCRRSGAYNTIENVFDASPIPEKNFIDDFLGVFSWHANKKSTYKDFVDKRDKCAHNSGFIQYDREDVENYFSDVLRNIERVSLACEDSLIATYTNSMNEYFRSTAFQTTTMVDYIARELANKKYSYRDIHKLLTISQSSEFEEPMYILSYHISRIYLSIREEEGGYRCDQSSDQLIEELYHFWSEIPKEEKDALQLQLEYEVDMLDEKGMSLPVLHELIEGAEN